MTAPIRSSYPGIQTCLRLFARLALGIFIIFALFFLAFQPGDSHVWDNPKDELDKQAEVQRLVQFTRTIVDEGFEGSFPPDGWTATGHWGQTSCEKKTGSYSAWVEGSSGLPCDSVYHANETSLLTYGPFDLSDALTARLDFQLWLWSSTGDTFAWQASSDGVNFFGSSLTNSFTPSFNPQTLDLAAVPGLGSLIGDDSVWIRFRWQTDGFAQSFEGAYVDDVKVIKTVAPKESTYIPFLYRACPAPGSLFYSTLSLGASSSAAVPDNTSLDLGVNATDDFTVEGFFYVPDENANSTASFFYKNYSYWLYIIFHNDQPDRLIYRIWLQPTTNYVYIYYDTELNKGWHHVAITFDNEFTSSWDLMGLFLDGEQARSSVSTEWTPGINNSSSSTVIGGSFAGNIEEVRISNTVRYSGLTYTIPSTPFISDASTVALWHFDEASGSFVFNDSSPYGNTLTGAGGAVASACVNP